MGDKNSDIIVKADQEGSAGLLLGQMKDDRAEGKTVAEGSPVGSTSSNGIVERCAQEIEGRIRV